MNAKPESIDLENDVIQWIVAEAVRLSLETPLREPILRGVEGAVDTDDIGGEGTAMGASSTESATGESGGGSRSTPGLKGLVAFAATSAVLYVLLRRLTGDAET